MTRATRDVVARVERVEIGGPLSVVVTLTNHSAAPLRFDPAAAQLRLDGVSIEGPSPPADTGPHAAIGPVKPITGGLNGGGGAAQLGGGVVTVLLLPVALVVVVGGELVFSAIERAATRAHQTLEPGETTTYRLTFEQLTWLHDRWAVGLIAQQGRSTPPGHMPEATFVCLPPACSEVRKLGRVTLELGISQASIDLTDPARDDAGLVFLGRRDAVTGFRMGAGTSVRSGYPIAGVTLFGGPRWDRWAAVWSGTFGNSMSTGLEARWVPSSASAWIWQPFARYSVGYDVFKEYGWHGPAVGVDLFYRVMAEGPVGRSVPFLGIGFYGLTTARLRWNGTIHPTAEAGVAVSVF